LLNACLRGTKKGSLLAREGAREKKIWELKHAPQVKMMGKK